VAIIEHQPHSVVPDGVDRGNCDTLLAGLQRFLPRPMADNLGARRMYAQILEAEAEFRAVLESSEDVPAQILVFRQLGEVFVDIAGIDLNVRATLVRGLE